MSKRTNSIVAVTIAKYATMYVEAETPEEAVQIAIRQKDEYICDEDFEDSELKVDSYETYTTECEDWMDRIWTPDGIKENEEYMDELKKQVE